MIYFVMGAYVTLCVPKFFSFTSLIHMSDWLGLMLPYLLACIFFGLMLSCLVRYRENVMLLVVFTSVPLLFMTASRGLRVTFRFLAGHLLALP